MAHRISMQNGKAEFAYVSKSPWHGLGERKAWRTPQEAMAETLPFEVALVPQYYRHNGALIENPSQRAIIRTDTGTRLGEGTDQYAPIQGSQVADVADALVAEGAKCVDTIGALDDGARCFMLLALDRTGFEIKGSAVLPYFLLRWGHDGRTPVSGKLTNVYVVCHNTLTAAGQKYDFNVRHHGNAKLPIEQAREALGVARKAYVETREQYRVLADTRLAPAQSEGYFADFASLVVPGVTSDEGVDEAKLARWNAVQQRVLALYNGQGKGSEANGPTAWGAYNAVTEWLDHVYPVKADGKVSVARQKSVLFDSYSQYRDAAYRSALAFAK